MVRPSVRRLIAASSPLLAIFVAACEVEKSKSPLSPSVAGPIAGVEITAPRALEPAQGARIKQSQQPIRLTVENASTSGVRPLSYTFELATDEGFQNRLYARSSVVPGDGGRTWVQLDRIGAGGTYFWRARAEDGANIGPYSSVRFEVLPPPELSAPALLSPINNERVGSLRPTLSVGASNRNAAVGPLTYEVHVAIDVAFAQIVANWATPESAGLNFTPGDLPANRQLFWRARTSDGETTSPWAATQTFQTPGAPAPPSPGPSPGPGGGGSCASRDGHAIVACISAKYPEKRTPVRSLGERQANMAFLRDRIIEAGKCGGLDLGHNLKRGGPEVSIDFLAWRRSDGEMGVDLGFDYDNIGTTLQLQWSEAGLGATYLGYPNTGCQ